ncbi:Cyclic nucleotide-gated cation channel alpha-3 [Clonorchis sinensis]|uniref:Cyclic nucleotide-gated cation channel alpha-3 n=1 Tax=Clonorchis sinensis TaxID=79923 RepID=A0A3R7JWM1_CLOSI|nr:Cyclic nucleotide-gated cation channel alpha-3 [Clonorchis sinensis]
MLELAHSSHNGKLVHGHLNQDKLINRLEAHRLNNIECKGDSTRYRMIQTNSPSKMHVLMPVHQQWPTLSLPSKGYEKCTLGFGEHAYPPLTSLDNPNDPELADDKSPTDFPEPFKTVDFPVASEENILPQKEESDEKKSPLPTELIEDHRRFGQSECSVCCVFQTHNRILLTWLTLLSATVLYNLWLPVARQSFYRLQEEYVIMWTLLDIIADLVYLLDIAVQMRSPYLDYGLVVVNGRKMIRHYTRSRNFRLDIISLLPLDLIQIKIGMQPLLRFPRFLKVYRALEWKNMVANRTPFPNTWRVVNLMHVMFLGCNWCACAYYAISAYQGFRGKWGYTQKSDNTTSLAQVYLQSFYWANLALATIGIHEAPETNIE